MPKEMHDRLKALAERKGMKGEQKDAFIYGTMRKTGWKPKREIDSKSKKETTTAMSSRLQRLIKLDSKLDQVIELRSIPLYDDDDQGTKLLPNIAAGTAAAGTGVGAFYGGRAIRRNVINHAGAVDNYGNLVARPGMYSERLRQVKERIPQAVEAVGPRYKALRAGGGAGRGAFGKGMAGVGRMAASKKALAEAMRMLEAHPGMVVRLNSKLDTILFERESRGGNFVSGGLSGTAIGAGIGGVGYGAYGALQSPAKQRGVHRKAWMGARGQIKEVIQKGGMGAEARPAIAGALKAGRKMAGSRLMKGGLFGASGVVAGGLLGGAIGSGYGAVRKPRDY